MGALTTTKGRLLLGLAALGLVVGTALGFALGRSKGPAVAVAPRTLNAEEREVVRKRAADREAQSALRNALVAEKTIYVDRSAYTTSISDLKAVEPSLQYTIGSTPDQTGVEREVVYVSVQNGVLYLALESASGTCFYVRDDPEGDTGYATSEECGPAANQTYSATGWRS